MNNEIKCILEQKGIDIVRFVDISSISSKATKGFNKAVLLCNALSKQFILNMHNNLPIDIENDEFLKKEKKIEELADWLAEYIKDKGYSACSQSEKNNMEQGQIEKAYINPEAQQGISTLPHKIIAYFAGLGFIGKNNLLITEQFGCALVMCSVLTNAPLSTQSYTLIPPKCGNCNICTKVCIKGAIKGIEWEQNIKREVMIDVSKCCCALKCMINCPFTLKYARSQK